MSSKWFVVSILVMVITIGFCVKAAENDNETQQTSSVESKASLQTNPKAEQPITDYSKQSKGNRRSGNRHFRGRTAPGQIDRQALYQQRMAQQHAIYMDLIKQLQEIRKIAESEQAAETVKAIDELVKKKQQEMQSERTNMEKRRQEMLKRIEQRMQERTTDQATGNRSGSPNVVIKDEATQSKTKETGKSTGDND